MPERRAQAWRLIAGVVAVLLFGLGEFVLVPFAAFGMIGPGLTFYAAPFALLVRTPRTWAWLVGIALVLALAAALGLACQLLARPPQIAASVARGCCRDGQWYDITPPSLREVATMCALMGVAFLVANFGALVLWKRVAFRSTTRTAS